MNSDMCILLQTREKNSACVATATLHPS